MTAKSEVYVGGVPISPFGIVGDLKWSSRWGAGPSGCDQASWTWDVSTAASLPGVTRGSEVEVRRNGKRRWLGNITEVTRGKPWTINAAGKAREALGQPALDGSAEPTVNPATALATADLSWLGHSGFSTSDFGTVDLTKINYLDALLNDSTAAEGKRWGVRANGYGFAEADPTSASWLLNAIDLDIGVADDRGYTQVVARYVSAVTGSPPEATAWDTVVVGSAGSSYIMDLTPLGLLGSIDATAYAQAQLDQFQVPTWNSRITVAMTNLTTPNGIPAEPFDVQAGQMVHLTNVPLTLGRTRTRLAAEVILGEVEYVDGAQEITLAPLNLAVRSIVDEIASRSPARSMVA